MKIKPSLQGIVIAVLAIMFSYNTAKLFDLWWSMPILFLVYSLIMLRFLDEDGF